MVAQLGATSLAGKPWPAGVPRPTARGGTGPTAGAATSRAASPAGARLRPRLASLSPARRLAQGGWARLEAPPPSVSPALGARRGALFAVGLGLNALGAQLAWSHLVPYGVPPFAGLLGGLALGWFARPREAVHHGPRARPGRWSQLGAGAGWSLAQLVQGGAWCLAFPGTRLASVPRLVGAALLGASLAPLAAVATRSLVHDNEARVHLAEAASRWLETGREGPFGAASWLVEGLSKVGLLGGALALGPWLMVPATVALALEWGTRAVALGVFRGCATDTPARDLHASHQLSTVSCVAAGAAVQLASIDWATVAACLRGAGRTP